MIERDMRPVDTNLLPSYPQKGEKDYEERKREYRRLYARIHRATVEGGAKARAISVKYSNSEKGKKTKSDYRKTDRYKELFKASRAKYRTSEKGKTTEKIYEQSDKGSASKRDKRFRKLGITRARVTDMVDDQEGLCAICRQPPTGNGACAQLQLDHCHETNKIRDMLCNLCNKALGFMKDDPTLLRASADYLERHR